MLQTAIFRDIGIWSRQTCDSSAITKEKSQEDRTHGKGKERIMTVEPVNVLPDSDAGSTATVSDHI